LRKHSYFETEEKITFYMKRRKGLTKAKHCGSAIKHKKSARFSEKWIIKEGRKLKG
jgi:hypothetical protein